MAKKRNTASISLILLAGILLFLAFFGRLIILGLQNDTPPPITPPTSLNITTPFTTNVFDGLANLYDDTTEQADPRAPLEIPYHSHNPVIGAHNAPITVVIFHDLACDLCRAQVATWHETLARHRKHLRVIYKFMAADPAETTGGIFDQIAWRAGVYPAFFETVSAQNTPFTPEDFLTSLEVAGLALSTQQTMLKDDMSLIIAANEQDAELIETLGFAAETPPLLFINGYQIGTKQLPLSALDDYLTRLKNGLTITGNR